MLLEAPYPLNGSDVDPSLPPRWRQMKCASFPLNAVHSDLYITGTRVVRNK